VGRGLISRKFQCGICEKKFQVKKRLPIRWRDHSLKLEKQLPTNSKLFMCGLKHKGPFVCGSSCLEKALRPFNDAISKKDS